MKARRRNFGDPRDTRRRCLTPRCWELAVPGGAVLVNADLSAIVAERVKFFASDMTNVQATDADLKYAELTAAKLNGADLEGADLRGAMLFLTNLTNANLKDANLQGARFANFFTIFTGVNWDNTTCGDGTNSNNNGDTCLGHMV